MALTPVNLTSTGAEIDEVVDEYLAGNLGGGAATDTTTFVETVPDNTVAFYDYDITGATSVDIVGQGVITASSAALEVQFSTDGGTTFRAGASDYAWGYTASTFETSGTAANITISDNASAVAQYIQARVAGLEGSRPIIHSSAWELSPATHRIRAGAPLFDGPMTHMRIKNNAAANFSGGKISVTVHKKSVSGGGGGGGATSINDLTDVDTDTVAPTDGQALVWSSADLDWRPGDVSSGGVTETQLFFQDFSTTSATGLVTLTDQLASYDEIVIEGIDFGPDNMWYRLSTDGTTFLNGASDYLRANESASVDDSLLDSQMFCSSGPNSNFVTVITQHNSTLLRTRSFSYVQNKSGFARLIQVQPVAIAAHTALAAFFDGATAGSMRVVGRNYGGGGGGGGGATSLNDLSDVATAGGSTGEVLTQQGDGSYAPEPADVASYSTGAFGVGIDTPLRPLHVMMDPSEASIVTVGDLASGGGLLLEANGPGAGPTGTYPGIHIISVNAGCGHIHFGDTADHQMGEFEYDHPSATFRLRNKDNGDASGRAPLHWMMGPEGNFSFHTEDIPSGSTDLFEGTVLLWDQSVSRTATNPTLQLRKDYGDTGAAERGPVLSMGLANEYRVNQLSVVPHYLGSWVSRVDFMVRNGTVGPDAQNDALTNMEAALTLVGNTNYVGLNGVNDPATELHVDGAITLNEKSSDPANPAEGRSVIWMSDGTGSGDDGDIMMKITAGATTKTITLVDFSAS